MGRYACELNEQRREAGLLFAEARLRLERRRRLGTDVRVCFATAMMTMKGVEWRRGGG